MEIKKTEEADLENKRTTRLLMALIVALALLFVAFEYTFKEEVQEHASTEMTDEWSEDLLPVTIEENMVVVVPKKTEVVAEKLKIEEEVVTEQEQQEVTDTTQHVAEVTDVEKELPDIAAPETNSLADDARLYAAEYLPQFPGGMAEFIKWLTKNLHYPYTSQRNNVEGKVVAQFVVGPDGTISDIKIVKSLDTYCDREAMRVLKLMPKWTAGTQNGKPCRTQVCLPIVFKK